MTAPVTKITLDGVERIAMQSDDLGVCSCESVMPFCSLASASPICQRIVENQNESRFSEVHCGEQVCCFHKAAERFY